MGFWRLQEKEREKKGKYGGSSLALWRRVVASSLPETVLGIAGLGESENKASRGGWGGHVVYVRQVGHQKYHRHQDHQKRHRTSREASYRT